MEVNFSLAEGPLTCTTGEEYHLSFDISGWQLSPRTYDSGYRPIGEYEAKGPTWRPTPENCWSSACGKQNVKPG